MWHSERPLQNQLSSQLHSYHLQFELPGIASATARDVLAWQMVASLRRQRYTHKLLERPICAERLDPHSALFDPERAAIYYGEAGEIDEAWWLIFLTTHFGKHGQDGWLLLRQVYGALGTGRWTWIAASQDPAAFSQWIADNYRHFTGRFGNHRKYESLRADAANGTPAVVRGYIDWIGPTRSHRQKIFEVAAANDPFTNFDGFYRTMNVPRFGRLARFDFLALVGRLGLAQMAPGSAYLDHATGPLRGARLLFGGSTDSRLPASVLQQRLTALDSVLKVGMQVMEDSLCNWQKSPDAFQHFTG